MGDEKMSKSLGNVVLAKDFFKENSADALRYIFITSAYSAPINLSEVMIEQANKQVDKLSKAFMATQLAGAEKVSVTSAAKLISE